METIRTSQRTQQTSDRSSSKKVSEKLHTQIHQGEDALQALNQPVSLAHLSLHAIDARWIKALHKGFGHHPIVIDIYHQQQVVGRLPLMLVKSFLFGKRLVSLPYLNTGGVVAEENSVKSLLIDTACKLAEDLKVRSLELRHEEEVSHSSLPNVMTHKVHMRLTLSETSESLWKSFKPKLRSQIRKPEKLGLTVHWGGLDLLDEFYEVFSVNMRDLGTPVYGKNFFQTILQEFGVDAELCIIRQENQPLAAGLLIHEEKRSQVPSASSLREFNHLSANMLLYWHMLKRAIERDQQTFDFGRSTVDSGTYRFKKQWGAEAFPAYWQTYCLNGEPNQLRPESGKFNLLIQVWQKLPVKLTQWIGPPIVKGIP
ncbi:Peptidoglycan bridge formation protein FemAB [Planctomycetales bacterium 10988]|nr:Peptidoglycan bridge formation protein FemAB [Planctomycetales bacterium 10988]